MKDPFDQNSKIYLIKDHIRDDLDTVAVKAGCTLHLWTRLDFAGAYTVVTAGFQDRLI